MNGRRFKLGAILLVAATLLTGMERNPIPSSFCNIVQSYKAVKNAHAPMGIWEQFVYTFALSKQRTAQSKADHGAA